MTTPHERLRAARYGAGFETASDAAKRFGWRESTYRAHENAQNSIRDKHAKIYARAFRVSPEWLLFGTGGPEKKSVPLVGHVGAGAEVFCVDDGGGKLDDIDPPPGIGPDAVAVLVRGDSMFPRYSDGDVIIYDAHIPLEKADGKECIVALTDGRRYVKNVRKNTDATYDLDSWNAPPIRNVQIEWVAEIIWVKRG